MFHHTRRCSWQALGMADKRDLREWVLRAVTELGGSATVVQVAEWIWWHHEQDLRAAGPLFYTWQYDMRWAAQTLRDEGRLRSTSRGPGSRWALPNAVDG